MDNGGNKSDIMESIPHEDRILFGSQALKISDELINIIDSALEEGVASLPRISNEKALLKMLQSVYHRNVHILEAYMARNIFSIQSFPPSKRRSIIDAYVTNKIVEIPLNTNVIENDKEIVNMSTSSYRYPTQDEIPSEEDIKSTEQELESLRQKLSQAKQRWRLSLYTGEELAKARQTLPNSLPSIQIIEKLEKLMESQRSLKRLTDKARHVMEGLESQSKQSTDEDIENENIPAMSKRRKKLGLEEAFQEDQKHISLQGVESLLRILNNRDPNVIKG
jgi:hypothetical protein